MLFPAQVITEFEERQPAAAPAAAQEPEPEPEPKPPAA